MNTLTEFEKISIEQSNKNFYLSIIVAIITFFSLLAVYLDYRNRKNKERAEKSINIAEEFAQNIIPQLALLYKFFEDNTLLKIINKHKFYKFSDFDIEELNELYTKEEIDIYTNTFNKTYSITIDKREEIISVNDSVVLLLNELEHMCMYIFTKVADDKYIYNSLHQQFLKSISILYISISLTNTDVKDKYYTSIIHVYNLWKNKYVKALKRENKFKKKQKKKKQKLLPHPQI